MQLAANAGAATGTAARMNANRPYDAQIAQQAIQSAAASANAPTFAQQHTGVGASAYQGDTGVQTFVNDQARADAATQRAQFEQVYGNPVEQQARRQVIAAGAQLNPSATPAQQNYAAVVGRQGGKLPKSVEEAVTGPTLEQGLKREEFTAKESGDQVREGILQQNAASRATAAQADMIRAQRTPALASGVQAHQDKLAQDNVAAYALPAQSIADSLSRTDPMTGKLAPEAASMASALVRAARSSAELGKRLQELETAGLPKPSSDALMAQYVRNQTAQAQQTEQNAQTQRLHQTAILGLQSQLSSRAITFEQAAEQAQQAGLTDDETRALLAPFWQSAVSGRGR